MLPNTPEQEPVGLRLGKVGKIEILYAANDHEIPPSLAASVPLGVQRVISVARFDEVERKAADFYSDPSGASTSA
jgi:hypothetical protein